MPISEVILETIGTDRRITELDTLLQGSFRAPPKVLPNGLHYAAVTLPVSFKQESMTIKQIGDWLRDHSQVLGELPVRKKLEIQAVLLPDQGSDGFSIPTKFMQLLIELHCELVCQYIRRLR